MGKKKRRDDGTDDGTPKAPAAGKVGESAGMKWYNGLSEADKKRVGPVGDLGDCGDIGKW